MGLKKRHRGIIRQSGGKICQKYLMLFSFKLVCKFTNRYF